MTTADFAAVAPWGGLTGRPASFPPSAHTHAAGDIERSGAEAGDVLTWDGKKYAPQSPQGSRLAVETRDALAKFEESLTLIAGDSQSLVRKTTDIEARLADSSAKFAERIEVVARRGEAGATVAREIVARLGDAEAKIKRTDEVLVSKDKALARATEEISAKIAANEASITTIRQTTATREYAEALVSQAIVATTGVTSAELTTILSAYATEAFAEAKKSEAIAAAAADATARVATEATARASADTANASNITTVSASVDKKVKVQSTAPTSPSLNDVWIDTSDNNKAKYWDGSAWQYKQDGVLYAAVVDTATASATRDGYLSGMRVIGVDVGGRVTGMRITAISDPAGWTTTSEVAFNASVFKIYDGSSSNIAPFVVSGGVVRMANAVVTGDIDISSGTTRLHVPVGGPLTYGNEGSNHIALENLAGSVMAAIKHGATRYAILEAPLVGAAPVGKLSIASNDGSLFEITGQVAAGAAPVLRWKNDTVLYRNSAGELKTDGQLTIAGAALFNSGFLSIGSCSILGGLSLTTPLLGGIGSASAPTYSFSAFPGSGMFHDSSSGNLRFATSGVARLVVRDAAVALTVPLKLDNTFVSGAPSATGYVTLQDFAGNTYKVLAGT
jgi:hypothetical protein